MNPAMNSSSRLAMGITLDIAGRVNGAMEKRSDLLGENLGHERLGQVERCALLEHFSATGGVAPCRKHHHRNVLIPLMAPDELEHLESVHVRHVEVENHQPERRQCQPFERL